MAVSVKLDEEMRERIQSLAESKQRSSHWVMREAIRTYVEKEEARLSFDEATLASWKDYQETGLHLTGEEVFAWMKTWGTDEETDAPPCHT